MGKTKYRFNYENLSYEELEKSAKTYIIRATAWLGFTLAIVGITLAVSFNFFKSPNHKISELKNLALKEQLNDLNHKLDYCLNELQYLEKKDNEVYRSVFGSNPIPRNIDLYGRGGRNLYDDLDQIDRSGLLKEASIKMDELKKRLYLQTTSYDSLEFLIKRKHELLSHMPAIQPIPNKDLKRMASGYGMRIHPILGYRRMHSGMDFTAPIGTEIYATGDGVVENVERKAGGYGLSIVINHGFGYKTRYAHMSRFNVKKGQKIKRGDIIGYVGNSGLSRGPHLHYEVIRNGTKVNPAFYYYNDLNDEEYEYLLKMAQDENVSMD